MRLISLLRWRTLYPGRLRLIEIIAVATAVAVYFIAAAERVLLIALLMRHDGQTLRTARSK